MKKIVEAVYLTKEQMKEFRCEYNLKSKRQKWFRDKLIRKGEDINEYINELNKMYDEMQDKVWQSKCEYNHIHDNTLFELSDEGWSKEAVEMCKKMFPNIRSEKFEEEYITIDLNGNEHY